MISCFTSSASTTGHFSAISRDTLSAISMTGSQSNSSLTCSPSSSEPGAGHTAETDPAARLHRLALGSDVPLCWSGPLVLRRQPPQFSSHKAPHPPSTLLLHGLPLGLSHLDLFDLYGLNLVLVAPEVSVILTVTCPHLVVKAVRLTVIRSPKDELIDIGPSSGVVQLVVQLFRGSPVSSALEGNSDLFKLFSCKDASLHQKISFQTTRASPSRRLLTSLISSRTKSRISSSRLASTLGRSSSTATTF